MGMFTNLIVIDDDEDIGCAQCGAISFIYAKGSNSICEQCSKLNDELVESNGGIDKCMNCGRYKYGNELDENQVCIRRCKNPNEW